MRSLIFAAAIAATTSTCAYAGDLRVEGAGFVLAVSSTERLKSAELVGAVFEIDSGAGARNEVRIDAVEPAQERPSVLLHAFSVRDPRTGTWAPMCDADAHGRRAGFPLKGRWEAGRFVADESAWFLTCTSGSQGKCVLWGYDPWGRAPDGRPLADYYRACQQMVRADYEGKGQPHTRNGTVIDVADLAGLQTHASAGDPDFGFEAGWGVAGAVCVARTRWPDLVTREALVAASPHLDGPCDEATARAKGALLFTRVKAR